MTRAENDACSVEALREPGADRRGTRLAVIDDGIASATALLAGTTDRLPEPDRERLN